MPNAIENPRVFSRIANIAATQIIAQAGIYDSNGAQTDPAASPDVNAVSGFLDTEPRLWAKLFGCAGSGVLGAANNVSTFNGVSGSSAGAPTAAKAGVPAYFAARMFDANITAGDGVSSVTSGFKQQVNAVYVADGATDVADTSQCVLFTLSNSIERFTRLLSVNEALIASIRYGTFETGTDQQWFPAVRRTATATIVVEPPASSINTVTGEFGLTDYNITIPAATRDYTMHVEGSRFNTTPSRDWRGPGIVMHGQFIKPNATTGATSSCLLYQGGLGSVEAATSLVTAPDLALAELFRSYVYPQIRLGQTPFLVITILHGGNDRNDSGQASWNPDTLVRNGVSSHTAGGVFNNTKAMIRRCLNVWSNVNQYDPTRLVFVVGPYPRQKNHVSTLNGYEDALTDLCSQFPDQVAVMRGTLIYDDDVFDDADFWRDGSGEDTDDAHQRLDGYLAAQMAKMAAIRSAIGVRIPPAPSQIGIGF